MTDELVHLVARVLLRVASPLTTYAILRVLGAVLPQRRGRLAIRSASERLRRQGTCLSRALALSARSPDLDVVIGALARSKRQTAVAHAWIELGGLPVDVSEVIGVEIARMPARRPALHRT